MNKMMDTNEDRLLRIAIERRAERVPALSDEFQQKVLSRLTASTGKQQVHRRWIPLAWMGNIAAAVVVGWFIFFKTPPEPITTPPSSIPSRVENVYTAEVIKEAPAVPSPLPPQGEGVYTAASTSSPRKAKVATPLPREENGWRAPVRAAGASSEEQTIVADLYATIDLMTDQALRDAERLAIETLSRNVAADTPS